MIKLHAAYVALGFALIVSTIGLFLIGNKEAGFNSLACLSIFVGTVEIFKHGFKQGVRSRQHGKDDTPPKE